MHELALDSMTIEFVKNDVVDVLKELIKDDLVEVILYGSCARGDYNEDSDIDIALITKSGRLESKRYYDGLSSIATNLAMKYLAVVNFVCIPYDEYMEKKGWYAYFKNIDTEGEVLYG
jgi:predicted nucleotidyltransferase